MVYASIWEDTYFQTTDSVLNYELYDGDTQIFKGRSYKRPNADYNEVKINKICENYLSNSLQNLIEMNATSMANEEAYKVFTLKEEDGTVLETYGFLYDWSYDVQYAGGPLTLSRPINGRWSDGQWKPLTNINAAGTVTNYKASGSYPYEVECGDYALIYLNSYGGWDSLLLEGTVVKKSTVTQYTTDKNYNNLKPQFELNRYISEIVDTYECNTGFFTDEQAANLSKNLIPSNEVYLQDLKEGTLIPVVITDTAITYQTYQTNGLQLPQYKINVKDSQTKIRR